MPKETSILGPAGISFIKPGGPIEDCPISETNNIGRLHFNIAGFTKPSKAMGNYSRQQLYHALWKLAVEAHKEMQFEPFNFLPGFQLNLYPEPDNEFDPNAIQVVIRPNTYKWYKYLCENLQTDRLDLGYVPALISKWMIPNLELIQDVKVFHINGDAKRSLYSFRTLITYGSPQIVIPTENFRFTLLED